MAYLIARDGGTVSLCYEALVPMWKTVDLRGQTRGAYPNKGIIELRINANS